MRANQRPRSCATPVDGAKRVRAGRSMQMGIGCVDTNRHGLPVDALNAASADAVVNEPERPVRILFHIDDFGNGETETSPFSRLRVLDRRRFAPSLSVGGGKTSFI